MSKEPKLVGKVLFDEKQIRKRAKELGEIISKDYEGEELILLGTLKGSLHWMADLSKCINNNAIYDFVIASSYGSSTISSGIVKIALEPTQNLYNKNVLVIEDIIDTGNTLAYLIKKLEERNPKSIEICTMLDKAARRTNDIKPKYVGFEIDDLFVVGYGLDYDEKYRNLPYISYLEADDVESL